VINERKPEKGEDKMPRLRERTEAVPFFHIWDLWKMASSDEYEERDDDTTVLPEIFAESDEKTDKLYDEHFGTKQSKGNSGKGKEGMKQYKLEKEQLNQEKTEPVPQKEQTGKDRDDR